MIQRSKVELQRHLDVALALGASHLPEASAETCSWGIKNRMIGKVDEFSAEFKALGLREKESFLDAQIERSQTRASHSAHTACSEAGGRLRIHSGIEPLFAASGNTSFQIMRRCVAVGTCPTGIRSRVVIRRNCKWEVFFFQAEDGIRDVAVTGVQTCALPI